MKSRFRRIGLPIGLFALVAGSIALTLLVGSSSANTAPDTQTLSPTNTGVFVQSPNAPTPPIGALGGPGYWKNHLANSKVGGPFYSTDCANVSQSGGSCSTSGPWALQNLSQSLGSFPVSDIIIAAQVFNAASCSSSKDQDAIGCLAGQLLATKLNLANGSLQCPGILQTVANADAFLNNQTG